MMVLESLKGPASYENWRKAIDKQALQETYEVPLFSDAQISGEIMDGLGPYKFFNPVPYSAIESLKPVIVLRIENRIPIVMSEDFPLKTEDELYHGGWLDDEISALVSLSLGVRFKPGGKTRIFSATDDPQGRPIFWEIHKDPILPEKHSPLIIPRARKQRPIDKIGAIFNMFPCLSAEDATILVRVARLYQDALWIAEAEPVLAWIMFVSAVEAAANHWRKDQGMPIERMRASKPEMEELLIPYGGQKLVEKVADLIADYMGATKQFIDFIITFLPDPPEDRPGEGGRHPWDRDEIEKTMRQVYDYRSKALHGGKRFPAPMCEPPMRVVGWEHPAEIPLGLAQEQSGGAWLQKDTRILLHTFEYIIREALLKWVTSLKLIFSPRNY